jgi:hypothetical protein
MSINGTHHSLIDQLKTFDRSGPLTKKQTRCASCRRKGNSEIAGEYDKFWWCETAVTGLYEAVSAETDREKVTELINRTEEAMMARTQELAHGADHADERNAMVQASKMYSRSRPRS